MAAFGKLPEVVIYTEFGIEHKALAIGSRELEHHTGENGEQLLNLVIVKPLVADACANCGNRFAVHGKPSPAHLRVCAAFEAPEPQAVVDLNSLVHIVTDVAHESHKFTAEQLRELATKGLTAYPGGQLPGGRWREIAEPLLTPKEVDAALMGAVNDTLIEVTGAGANAKPVKPVASTETPSGDEPPPTVN